MTEPWIISLVPMNLIDITPSEKRQKIFILKDYNSITSTSKFISLNLMTNSPTVFPITISYNFSPISTEAAITYATVILVGLYILIIFEIIHRTLAAMLASTMALAILAAMNQVKN